MIAPTILKDSVKVLCRLKWLSLFLCWKGPTKGQQVALTFDDGIDPVFTPKVLQILQRFRVRATFFILGNSVERNSKLLATMIDQGHEIGIHGWNHSVDNLPFQVNECAKKLKDFGLTSSLYRPPGGRIKIPGFLWLAFHGFRTVLWSVDFRDSMRAEGKWPNRSPNHHSIGSGDIVLFHDDNEICVRELPSVLNYLNDRQIKAVRVSELFGKKAAGRKCPS